MFFATSDFLNAYNDLLGCKKCYASIGTDIYNLFCDKKIDDIFEFQQFIDNKPPNYRVIKCRIANTTMKEAENSGFRLYYNVLKNKNIVCLLYIYPKTGKRQTNAIKDTFAKQLTKTFASEYQENKLKSISLDITNKCLVFP